jgi:feruloyl esterase
MTRSLLIAEKRDASGKVIRTRPLFPYPQSAKYEGSGNKDEEKNFRSKERNRAPA